LIDGSGLNWEKKMRGLLQTGKLDEGKLERLLAGDLKGMASRFLALKGDDGGLLNRFVTVLENIQVLNHFGLEEEGKIFLPFPVELPHGLLTAGQLLLRLPLGEGGSQDRKGGGEDAVRVSFLLEFSNLGPLRADITVRGKEVLGRFLVAAEEARLTVDKNLPELIEKLAGRGFSPCRLECRVKPPEEITRPLLREMVHEEGASLNLVA
jgi:hypothetical protein